MATEISRFSDVSGIGADFDTGTLCGPGHLETYNGTSKCFTINSIPGRPGGMVIMPRLQALIVASQIANQYGYKLQREE